MSSRVFITLPIAAFLCPLLAGNIAAGESPAFRSASTASILEAPKPDERAAASERTSASKAADEAFYVHEVPTPDGLLPYDDKDPFANFLIMGYAEFFRRRLLSPKSETVYGTYQRLVYAGPAAVPILMRLSTDNSTLLVTGFSFYNNSPDAFEAIRMYRLVTVGELAREGLHELTYVKSATLDYDAAKLDAFYRTIFLPTFPVARYFEGRISGFDRKPRFVSERVPDDFPAKTSPFMDRVLHGDLVYFRDLLMSANRQTVTAAYQRLVYAGDTTLPILNRLAGDNARLSVTTFPYYVRSRETRDKPGQAYIHSFKAQTLSDLAAFGVYEITAKPPVRKETGEAK